LKDTTSSFWNGCKAIDESPAISGGTKDKFLDENNKEEGECDKIYAIDTSFSDYKYKNIYDYWVISIVFSCCIIAIHIGLAILGFLLFKESNGLTPIK